MCVYINIFIFSQTITPLTIDSLIKATQIILLRSDAHQTQQHWIRGPPLQWHTCRRHHLNSLLSTIIFTKFGYFLSYLFLFVCSNSSLCQQIYFHILLILSNFLSHYVQPRMTTQPQQLTIATPNYHWPLTASKTARYPRSQQTPTCNG